MHALKFSCRLACAERITIYAETRFNNARWTLYVRTGRSLNVQRTFVERSLSVGETHSFVQNHALTFIERPASDDKASEQRSRNVPLKCAERPYSVN